MKTKEEITAEIAQGVREATRQRAEAEIAREYALRTELEKEARTSENLRKEKRARFYYKVSYLLLTASGLGGGLSAIIVKNEINWYVVASGVFMSAGFALLADRTLTTK